MELNQLIINEFRLVYISILTPHQTSCFPITRFLPNYSTITLTLVLFQIIMKINFFDCFIYIYIFMKNDKSLCLKYFYRKNSPDPLIKALFILNQLKTYSSL